MDKAGNAVANGFNNGGLWSITDPLDPAVDLIVKRVSPELGEGKSFKSLSLNFLVSSRINLLHFLRTYSGVSPPMANSLTN
jgi:hypothetical protein